MKIGISFFHIFLHKTVTAKLREDIAYEDLTAVFFLLIFFFNFEYFRNIQYQILKKTYGVFKNK